MEVRDWNNNDLIGEWIVTQKIDGVRAERVENGWVSKAGEHTLYGLDDFTSKTKNGEIYEYFIGDWNSSMHIMAHDNVGEFSCMYKLYPEIDERLHLCVMNDPTAKQITDMMNKVVADGYEGLVLRQGETFIKVKPVTTYDVEVLGIYEGKGKFKDNMGGVYTERGKIGGGWRKSERSHYWHNPKELIGKIIEVKSNGFTKNGKFRFGSLLRIRNDKTKTKA